MNTIHIVRELAANRDVFKSLLSGLTEEVYLWKPTPEKWCLLEIICHLHDEECEDFRIRTRQVLEEPEKALPPIDPMAWVEERKYRNQDFQEVLANFLHERDHSLQWLSSLRFPKWQNTYLHPKLGPMTAALFLSNWLAHDYLHIRQILYLKRAYHAATTDDPLVYAGNW